MHTTGVKHSGCAGFAQLPAKRPRRCSCRVQAVQSSQQSSKKPAQQADCEQDRYPHEDASKDDGFFPRRQPGTFPEVKVKNFWSKAKDKLGFTAPEEAESTGIEFDPLRDGPLRYLGYANECGSAFLLMHTLHASSWPCFQSFWPSNWHPTALGCPGST